MTMIGDPYWTKATYIRSEHQIALYRGKGTGKKNTYAELVDEFGIEQMPNILQDIADRGSALIFEYKKDP